MKKVSRLIKNIMNSSIVKMIAIVAIMSLLTWSYMVYTSPKDLYIKYDAIAYQSSASVLTEATSIEIEGKYKKSLFGEINSFSGKIVIGDNIINDVNIPIKFNKNKFASILFDKDEKNNLYGIIFISGLFEKVTIQTDKYRIGAKEWWISAPSNTILEAKQITNTLIKKANMKFVID